MNIQTRAVNILTRPAQEWRTIAGESTDVARLIRDYAGPLSGIAAICRWLGTMLLLGRLGGIGFLSLGIRMAILWAFGLVGIWIAAIVIEHLAPSFSSRASTVQAAKLVVYASTPIWIAGILALIPQLGLLVILGAIYAVYLFYVGLPIVMDTPAGKVVPYMVASAIVVFIANYIVSAATQLIAAV